MTSDIFPISNANIAVIIFVRLAGYIFLSGFFPANTVPVAESIKIAASHNKLGSAYALYEFKIKTENSNMHAITFFIICKLLLYKSSNSITENYLIVIKNF